MTNEKRGGKRENAGRKKQFSGKKTITISIELFNFLQQNKKNKSYNQYLIDVFASVDNDFSLTLKKYLTNQKK